MNKLFLIASFFLVTSLVLCQAPTPRTPNQGKRTVQWWENDEFLDTLGITAEEQGILKPRMTRAQFEIQALKTKLKITRKKLNKCLFERSGKTQREEIERELLKLYEEMEKQKFTIRHWVSTFFGASKLDILKKDYPLFFNNKWFKNSRIPVVIGRVGPKDDGKK